MQPCTHTNKHVEAVAAALMHNNTYKVVAVFALCITTLTRWLQYLHLTEIWLISYS